MIALCREHADKADNGAFTDAQLRAMKDAGPSRARAISGRFDWLRRDLLAVVGGSFYLKLDVILQIGTRPCIWFSRNEEGEAMLNFWMPASSGLTRARVLENTWLVPPTAADVECPPSGRLLHVRYPEGDERGPGGDRVRGGVSVQFADRALGWPGLDHHGRATGSASGNRRNLGLLSE